ncbi:MAG: hypothetical protein EBQ96_02085 [Proteobacteria bacterium]|nr:hypothetical protein [Pseudomonadota bacterium]
MKFRLALLLFSALLVAGCSTTTTPDRYYSKRNITPPTMQDFPSCRGYGCTYVDRVSFAKRDWRDIKKLFPAKTAEKERARIAKAIGVFEKKVGAKTGTHEDVRDTYIKGGPFQQDCVDESTNTTTYLTLLEKKGLLKFHTVSAPNSRLFFTSGNLGPHSTAVIVDKKSGTKYAVDSWFHDNGHDAEIVTLPEWKSGWAPKEKPQKAKKTKK